MDEITKNLETHYNSIPVKIPYVTLRRFYDLLQYTFYRLPFSKQYKVISEICKIYNLKNKKILDIGSFTGYNSFYFACMRNNVTGIELSNKTEMAKLRYRLNKIKFIHVDVLHYNEFYFLLDSADSLRYGRYIYKQKGRDIFF